ncbi:hypothetical protein BDR22DRAFT_818828 [Usnea florida]
MERVRNFVQRRISKVYGLLQVFRAGLLLKIQADIESGPLEPLRRSSTDDSFIDTPEVDISHVPNAIRASDEDQNERDEVPQPQFTKGPARFVVANDGSENCMALFVTDTLMTKLNDLLEDKSQFEVISGSLEHARFEARKAQTLVDEAEELVEETKQSLEKDESQERIEELQKVVQQHQRRLEKAGQKRDKLEAHCNRVERSIALSQHQALWAISVAMTEAHLTRPPTAPSHVSDKGDESDNSSEELPQQPPTTSASRYYTEPQLSESEQLRQAAREELDKRSHTLDLIQAKFDNQRNLYEQNLAKYQEGFRDGTYNFSRTIFDCRKLEYSQNVTRALIEAEEAYDEAEEYAKGIGAIGSTCDQDSSYGQYEESLPDDHMASYLAQKDWGSVHKWLANVPDHDMLTDPNSQYNPKCTDNGDWKEDQNGPENAKGSEEDDWDVPEVEIQDSASAIDYDYNRKYLDRWQQLCAQPLPEASPEAWDTWPEAFHMWPVNEIERRQSFGGYSCHGWDD